MRQALAAIWVWLRVQLFRFWTALTVLGTCGYFWLYKPEYLTWWKRNIDALIEGGSSQRDKGGRDQPTDTSLRGVISLRAAL